METDMKYISFLKDINVVASFFLQGILDRVKNIEDFNNVGWVCVDQRPIKDTLNSLANKWKRVYSSYLEKQASFRNLRLKLVVGFK